MGWMGLMGLMGRGIKNVIQFSVHFVRIYIIYVSFYLFPKVVTNILMALKILTQVGELGYDFQNYPMYLCFLIFHTESMVFQTHGGRPQAFFSKFDVKLGSWGMIFKFTILT